MAGSFFQNLMEPHNAADLAAVTLATTDKAMYGASFAPPMAGLFSRIGKKVRVEFMGRMTTAATPGNLTADIYWGSGADATGTILASSAALTLVASQTNLSWGGFFDVECRAIGSAGLLFATGELRVNPALIASTAQPIMIPASAPVVSGSVDLTTGMLSLQLKRSGSTAETAQLHKLNFIELN